MDSTSLLADASLASSVLALLALLLLHFLSPEFKPSWRMISEYALGKHKYLLSLFFVFWALASAFLAALLWGEFDGFWLKFGAIFLMISAVGELMGGLFDVKHKLHGLSFALGVPSLPIAALIMSYQLNDGLLMVLAHATWICIVLMALGMIVLFSGFKKAGIPVGPEKEAPEKLPDGVIAFSGYANRLLVVAYIAWLITCALTFLN